MVEMVTERDDGPPSMYLATSSGYDEHGETCNTECELALSRACRDGDFKRFTELANEEWTVRTFKYRVDLMAVPDQTTSIQDEAGNTCTGRLFLHHACVGGNVDIVKHHVDLHVKRGSGIHQKGSMGRTPLLLACLRGHLACVRLLGWSGFAIANRLGQTPFHAAC